MPEAPPLDLTDAQVAARKQEIRAHYAQSRHWAPGRRHQCPKCGRKTLMARDDLHCEVPRGLILVVYRNLKGAVCGRCGSRFFEASETDAIEDDLANAWRVSFETKITTIGRESLGIYWPREVARNTGMAKNDRVRIEVIDPKTLVLHLD